MSLLAHGQKLPRRRLCWCRLVQPGPTRPRGGDREVVRDRRFREFGSYVLGMGVPASDVAGLLASAEEAVNLLLATPTASANGSIVRRSRSVALDVLITHRRTDPALPNYVERML